MDQMFPLLAPLGQSLQRQTGDESPFATHLQRFHAEAYRLWTPHTPHVQTWGNFDTVYNAVKLYARSLVEPVTLNTVASFRRIDGGPTQTFCLGQSKLFTYCLRSIKTIGGTWQQKLVCILQKHHSRLFVFESEKSVIRDDVRSGSSSNSGSGVFPVLITTYTTDGMESRMCSCCVYLVTAQATSLIAHTSSFAANYCMVFRHHTTHIDLGLGLGLGLG